MKRNASVEKNELQQVKKGYPRCAPAYNGTKLSKHRVLNTKLDVFLFINLFIR